MNEFIRFASTLISKVTSMCSNNKNNQVMLAKLRWKKDPKLVHGKNLQLWCIKAKLKNRQLMINMVRIVYNKGN